MKTKPIGYWVTTAIVAFVLLSGGAAELARRRETVEGMTHLGYPLYFTLILGILEGAWRDRPAGAALSAAQGMGVRRRLL